MILPMLGKNPLQKIGTQLEQKRRRIGAPFGTISFLTCIFFSQHNSKQGEVNVRVDADDSDHISRRVFVDSQSELDTEGG